VGSGAKVTTPKNDTFPIYNTLKGQMAKKNFMRLLENSRKMHSNCLVIFRHSNNNLETFKVENIKLSST